MESLTHALTIDTVRPATLGAMQEVTQRESQAPPAGRRALAGSWTSVFGTLNQLYRLWQVDGTGAGLRSLARPSVLQDRQEKLLSARTPVMASNEGPSLYELRLYRIEHGRIDEFVELMMEIFELRQTWSKAVGVWVPLTGDRNELVHLWPYRDLEHRARTRATAAAHPQWKAYLRKIVPMLTGQTSLLLTPTEDSLLR